MKSGDLTGAVRELRYFIEGWRALRKLTLQVVHSTNKVIGRARYDPSGEGTAIPKYSPDGEMKEGE